MTITEAPAKSAFEELFGDAEIISTYTVHDALADGTLVQISEKLTSDYGFRWPVIMTKAAWREAVQWTRDESFQDEDGRAWDVLTILRLFAKRLGDGPITSHVVRVSNWTATGRLSKAVTASPCVLAFSATAMSPAGEPCFMISLPGED